MGKSDGTLRITHYLLYVPNMSDYSIEEINNLFNGTKNKTEKLINVHTPVNLTIFRRSKLTTSKLVL